MAKNANAAKFFLMAAILSGSAATYGAYQFASVGDNTGAFAQPATCAINNSGSVVVDWLGRDGNPTMVVNGPQARTVALGNSSNQSTGYFNVDFPSINISGDVGFWAAVWTPSRHLELQRDTAGSKTTIKVFNGGDLFATNTSINDSGIVAYNASLGGVNGIYTTDGATVARVGGNGFQGFTSPTIANNGFVYFRAQRNNNFGLYAAKGSTVLTIADSTGPISDVFNGPPSVNNSGQVAFVANLDAGGKILYVGNGSTMTPVEDTSSLFQNLSWSSINNSGQVAFQGILNATNNGIYLTSATGGPAQRIIGVGDPLFGSTATRTLMFDQSLNDSGQIAFEYTLQNGIQGVAVASPVPEPTSGAIVLSSGLLIARRRRSKAGKRRHSGPSCCPDDGFRGNAKRRKHV